jgi:DNA helicase-2/ATP-dependent DNA helicase PcrA
VIELFNKTKILELLKIENTAEANARYDNLQEFLSLAKYFTEQNTEDNSLRIFLQDVALVNESSDDNKDDNKVSLMTIHSAKGLEFPIVFVTGLEEKLFPLNPDEKSDLEEERRLFYVALTRARKKLFVSYAKNRYRFGNLQSALKSRFIDELDGASVVTEGGKSLDDVRYVERDQKRILRDEYDQSPSDDFTQFTNNWKKTTEKKKYSNLPSSPSPESPFAIGMRVQHKIFGLGKIISLQGLGDDAKVKVFFKTAGEKTLVLKFANLSVVA